MADSAPGREALRTLDLILSKKPKKDDMDLSRATECLTSFREVLIRTQQAPGMTSKTREDLSKLNAVLSVVLGSHFPLGETPWDELDKARDWLASLVAEASGHSHDSGLS